ncbi:class I SAM-dependent methyltransferase [Jannaschia sp. R86511]|uniref:class I SAM-dependent methyltransferase n=1 Tax=Jannaschia sp. R86511 TaxID=3093853 RepID=UPI0036D26F59
MSPPPSAAGRHDDAHREQQARSFGAVAEEYDRVRPGYPAEVVRWALGEAPLRVLDLGAGTGKATRVLLEQGHDVVAVEPDPQMRERLRSVSPQVRALAGTGEAVPLPDGSVDAVLVAQAWHWMDHGRAAVEVARVLRPGGVLVLLWNVRDRQDPVARVVSGAVARHAPELAERARADSHADRLDVSVPDPRLVAAGTHAVDSSLRCSVDDLLALVSTWSYVALSPHREALLAEVARGAAGLVGPDGRVRLGQSAHAHRFRRG